MNKNTQNVLLLLALLKSVVSEQEVSMCISSLVVSNFFGVRSNDCYNLAVGAKNKRDKLQNMSSLSPAPMNAVNKENFEEFTSDVHNDKTAKWTTMPFVPGLFYKIDF